MTKYTVKGKKLSFDFRGLKNSWCAINMQRRPFGFSTHGKSKPLRAVKNLERERGNPWFNDRELDLDKTLAIWVTHKPEDAIYYLFPSEFRELTSPPDEDNLKADWKEFLRARTHPMEYLKKVDLRGFIPVLDDGDGGFLYINISITNVETQERNND